MRATFVVLVAAAMLPAVAYAEVAHFDGSAAAIRAVVSGKTCVGQGVLTFGESAPGSDGTFKRAGRPDATYRIGYGTLLIRRGNDLHGHLTSVSVPDRVLYLSTSAYQCGK